MNRPAIPTLRVRARARWPTAGRTAVLSCIVAAAGCAQAPHNPCSPFRAAWYVDDSDDAKAVAKKVIAKASAMAPASASTAPAAPAAPAMSGAHAPTVFLALLNEGPNKLEISRLSVNPSDLNDGIAVRLWPDPPSAANPELSTGEIRLFVVNDPDVCALPVVVKLQCGAGPSHTQAVSGSLPNYLHIQWIKSCVNGAKH